MSSSADAARVRVLRKARLPGPPAEEAFDRLARLALHAARASTAWISLATADRQHFKSVVGPGAPRAAGSDAPLRGSLCERVMRSATPLVVSDAAADPGVRESAEAGAVGDVAFVGVPLVASGGVVLGCLCVAAPAPRAWTGAEVQAVRDAAAAVSDQVRARIERRRPRGGPGRLRAARAGARGRAGDGQALGTGDPLGGIIASAMDAIISIDTSQRIVFFNAAAEAMFGCPAGEALGAPLERFIPPRHRQAHRSHVERFGQTGGTNRSMAAPGALTALRADGSEFPIEATISQVELGGSKLYTVIVRDVSERRAAEAELAHLVERELRARELVTNILESITDAFFALDGAWRFTYVNAQAEALLGSPRAALLGRVLWTEFPAINGTEFESAYRRAVAENCPAHVDARDDAAGHWLEVRAYPGRDGLSVYIHDVSQRRRAEEALQHSEGLLRSVLTGISDSIFVKNLEGRYILVNPACADAIGRPADEIVGRTDVELFPALSEHVAAIDRGVVREGAARRYEQVLERFGAGARRYAVTKVPLRAPDGAVTGVLGVAEDVTERRALEEQLRQSQKMEAVGRLAGGVAHDFNNVLMAIGGHARLVLRRLAEGDPIRRSLEEISRGTERAASLTRQLLAFSRQQVLQPRVLDPGAVVEGMAATLERLIGDNVEMVTELAHTGRVLADPVQLEQVILNLAVNAEHAMPDGGVLVIRTADAELGPDDAARYPYVVPGAFILLSVSDSGRGMDEATLERAFDPFFTTHADGTGLGLATVYGIVKQSHGYVWAESEPGVATTFRVYLPRVETPLAPAAPEAETAAPERFGAGTVLLVEDDLAVLLVAQEALEEAGFTVLAAADGGTALRLAELHPGGVDVLLSDVVMPRISGPQLARLLRQRIPSVAVVFMSGYLSPEVADIGMGMRDARVLQKPVDPAVLVREVAAAIETRRPR